VPDFVRGLNRSRLGACVLHDVLARGEAGHVRSSGTKPVEHSDHAGWRPGRRPGVCGAICPRRFPLRPALAPALPSPDRLTWFHAALIALWGLVLGYRWDLEPRRRGSRRTRSSTPPSRA